MDASDLFIFAGAGLSFGSGLPGFDSLRASVIEDLELDAYGDKGSYAALQLDMAPEAFMSAMQRSGIDVSGWLSEWFETGRPSTGHVLAAGLAAVGASVWTVNFDELIEHAAENLRSPLECSSWPDEPAATARVLKPHGSISASIVVTAESVLEPIREDWLARLRYDVAGRTAVFIGYSGRDLDFRPVWPEVLRSAREVVWFDIPASSLRRVMWTAFGSCSGSWTRSGGSSCDSPMIQRLISPVGATHAGCLCRLPSLRQLQLDRTGPGLRRIEL